MFKNFSKVFKFTFHNQVTTKGYKIGTILFALLLFAVPAVVLFFMGASSEKDEEGIKSCGADKIYVVSDNTPLEDFNSLNALGVEEYTAIEYIPAKSVDDALDTVKAGDEKTSLILEITHEDRISERIIIPENSTIDKTTAENYEDFIEEADQTFTVLASGLPMQELAKVSIPVKSDVYTADGYASDLSLMNDKAALKEQNNNEILKVANMVLTFLAIIVIYFIVIMYGNGIMQNVVLEKSNKLMDTMLVSIHPQALIFGKMMGILAAAFLQLFVWIAALVGGFVTGYVLVENLYPKNELAFITFLKSFKEMNLFTPINVIIGVLVLLLGIVFYCSISAICGAISSSREQAASNQGIFVILILVSFYIVIFNMNGTSFANWIYLLPCTGAFVLPSGVCTGLCSTSLALAGLGIMVVLTGLLLFLAGKLYTMMSLYKGNKVDLVKAFKMLASNK